MINLFVYLVMLTIASFVSLAVGIWEDYSPRHPPDEPRVGWYVLHEGGLVVVAGSLACYTADHP